jgi:hypothetical protein
MKNIIAWTQWTFFVIGLGFVLSAILLARYLWVDWHRLTAISITQCARAITQESDIINREVDLEIKLSDLAMREAEFKKSSDKVCAAKKK